MNKIYLKKLTLLLGFVCTFLSVKAQVYTFTNAGATGINGPSQAQVDAAYAMTTLSGAVTSSNGIQLWTVPVGGNYKIEVYGAEGYGPLAGKGAYMSGVFMLSGGQQLKVLVGQQGGCCVGSGTNQYGGGGGSYVVTSANVPLIIAGGGGGARYNTAIVPASHGTVNNNGNPGTGSTNGAGGTGGNGGAEAGIAGGGGGFTGNGGGTPHGGKSFLNGGQGGTATSSGGWGGFGGGGGANSWDNGRGGGGGGYSGGGGAGSATSGQQVGGGGGSYNTGTSQSNAGGVRSGHGLVVITLMRPPVPNDAGVINLPSLSTGFCPGNILVTARLKNFGSNFIDSVFVNWSVNNVNQGGRWVVTNMDTSGRPSNELNINLGNYNFGAGTFTVKAWTSRPNNQNDTVNINDTFTFTGSTKLGGTYTLNNAQPTAGTNFNSFTDLANALNTVGVCAPVIVNVVSGSGPYNSRFVLGSIPGASAVNTITINGNGRALQYNSTAAADAQIVVFNGTRYVTINNLVIKALSSTYGWGVAIAGDSRYDTIRNCHIDLSTITGASSANSNGITISGSVTSPTATGLNSNIYIEGNLIDAGHPTTNGGAYYGITVYGSSSSTFGADSIWLVNNEIKNYYYMGIYTYYTNEVHIIGNNLHRPLKTATTTVYGIYTYYMGRGSVKRNRLHDFTAPTVSHTNSVYAIYLNYPNYSSSVPKRTYEVSNNAIYNVGGGGINYLLYVYGGDSAYVAHNTIHVNQTGTSTSTMYGLYVYNTTNSYTLKNNLVTYTGGNSGTKYGIYCSNAAFNTNRAMQNNNVYFNTTQSGTRNRIYYNSTAYTTWTAFRAANPNLENGSLDIDPLYLNQSTGNLKPTDITFIGSGEDLTAVVPRDIDNQSRIVPPTPGAFDMSPQEWNNAGVDSLLSPGTTFCSGSRNIAVRVRNYGLNNIDTIQVHWTLNNVPQSPVTHFPRIDGTSTSNNNTALVVLESQFLAYGRSYTIRAWTFNPNNRTDNYAQDDTLTITISPTSTIPVNLGNDTTICDNNWLTLVAGQGNNSLYSYRWDNSSVASTRTVNTDGIYYVVKTEISSGCAGVDTIVVATKPAPVVDLGPDVAICRGDSVRLDVGAANYSNNILWSDSNTDPVRVVYDERTYHVRVTAPNGCFATDEMKVIYRDEPLLDGLNMILMLDGSYNFNIKNPLYLSNVIWDFGDGSPRDTGLYVNHKYTRNGLYRVTAYLVGECGIAAELKSYQETLDVFDATSITGVEGMDVKLYPNPAQDVLTIEVSGTSVQDVAVYTILGQKVLTESIRPGTSVRLNTSALPSGMYQVMIITDKGNVIRKVEILK